MLMYPGFLRQPTSTRPSCVYRIALLIKLRIIRSNKRESDFTITENNNAINEEMLYTDDPALSGALGRGINLSELGTHFNSLQVKEKHISIFVAEIQEACSQNDQESWLELYLHWVNNWLLPAIDAVDKKNCSQVKLITDDGFCYQYNSFSKWCFWR